MAGTNTTPDYPKDITLGHVWVDLQETRRIVQETALLQKETEIQAKKTERQAEKTERQLEKTERQLEKMMKQLGGLGNSIGELIETLMAARLWEKFSGYEFGFKQAQRRVMVYENNTSWQLTEIDILLSDTKWVMAVEVKNEVKKPDVEDHLKRMKLIRDNPPAEARGKRLLGAMAGGTVDPKARDFAYESCLFVLELRGDSVDLIPPPEGFSPKEW